MEAQEHIRCRGHRNITAMHPGTFEVTTDNHLTRRGDCIVGIDADKGACDLSRRFVDVLAHDGARLLTRVSCGDLVLEVHSSGSPSITLVDQGDMVWRRSGFVCARTIAISSDLTARTFPRPLIALLRTGNEMEIILLATAPD